MKIKTKSPLSTGPLRVPGQSLDEQLRNLIDDKVVVPLVVAAMLVIMVMGEWTRYFFKQPPNPWPYTVIAVCGLAWIGWRLRSAWNQLQQLKQGRDGERKVGQMLERLRAVGFSVFHDVPTGDANIDHVLIGTRGVYTIETKTLSKPVRGECKIRVTDEGITANGRMLDRNPLVQAKAQAGWLRNYFSEASLKVNVRSVVLFPGWFVEPHDRKAARAWVLEPKALEGFMANERESIPQEQASAMALALANYVRMQSKR